MVSNIIDVLKPYLYAEDGIRIQTQGQMQWRRASYVQHQNAINIYSFTHYTYGKFNSRFFASNLNGILFLYAVIFSFSYLFFSLLIRFHSVFYRIFLTFYHIPFVVCHFANQTICSLIVCTLHLFTQYACVCVCVCGVPYRQSHTIHGTTTI